MKIHLPDFSAFSYFIGCLKVVNEEQTLTITENGIGAQSMDPSHVAMVSAKMNKTEKFSLADFSSDEPEVKVTVNVSELTRVLDRIDKKEKVELEYDTVANRFIVKATRSGQARTFKLYVMEPSEEELPSPKISFKADARIKTDALYEALKDVDLWSEHAVFESVDEAMAVIGKGDSGDNLTRWTKESEDLLEYKSDEDSKATYTLSYLTSIIGQARKEAPVLRVRWSNDMPIEIEVESLKEGVEVTYHLAPCIGV